MAYVVHLQGIGEHPAKPAAEVVVGDKLAYNCGYNGLVKAIETRGSSLQFTIRMLDANGDEYGPEHKRLKRPRTLVAVVGA